MGIWNKLTVEVDLKQLTDFKTFSVLFTLHNSSDVYVSLAAASEKKYGGTAGGKLYSQISREYYLAFHASYQNS